MVCGGKARVAEGAVLYKKGVLRQKTLRTVALTLRAMDSYCGG